MCETAEDGVGISNSVPAREQLKRLGLRSADLSELMPFARDLANARENRDSHIGFVGYNKTVPGNKVLIAVDREYDLAVPNAVAEALREKGAHVDVLQLARGDGRHERLLRSLARVDLLILDDWGLAPMTAERRRDLLEIMEDRHARASTIVTSQLPVEHWHDSIGDPTIADPTIADAILDRLVHNAHRLTLKGESLRKAAAKRQSLDAEPAV